MNQSNGTRWKFLEHKGPVFAPPYKPIPGNTKFCYDGKKMRLSENAEEVAGFYAQMLDKNYTTKEVFKNNFFEDWRNEMTEGERSIITDISKCNFKEMSDHFKDIAKKKQNCTKEEKQSLKEQNEKILQEYGFCTIDERREKIGNFKVEPPGLFRPRGEHPKMGKLKKRVMLKDVVINCSKDSVFPTAPPGHSWQVKHNRSVAYLASWRENVKNELKYVQLGPSSKLKGEEDKQKYEMTRELNRRIDIIRRNYMEEWQSEDRSIQQRAVALYFLDKLALRAGNEKGEDQADTVGCCSLRVKHIQLHEQMDDKKYVVVFDFLGKDSVRYYKKVSVEERVFKNLQLFVENKEPGDELFDLLNTAKMNEHLNTLMEGLRAKVIRTYRASSTLKKHLDELTDPDGTVAVKILCYNLANRAVAILLNHQRTESEGHFKAMEELKAQIEALELAVNDATEDARTRGNKQTVCKKKKQLELMRELLAELEIQNTDGDKNKTFALDTAKLNYIDPRIIVAWCKKYKVPIEKIYRRAQRKNFRWAIDNTEPDWVY